MRRRPERWLAPLLFAAGVATLLVVTRAPQDEPHGAAAAAAGWQGLLGARPAPLLGERQIVVLKAASLADRVRRAGGVASERQMRAWTEIARRKQEEVLVRLAFAGAPIEPESRYVRVVNGFAAPLDARAIAAAERDPGVAGVYPVRAAYPAALPRSVLETDAFSPASGRRPDVGLAGFDGGGVTVAILDTGIDLAHPYVRDRLVDGIDVVDPGGDASARPNPSVPGRFERHGTEMAGIVAGSDGPGGLHGVAPGASILPVRVAGWQPDASGDVAVYGRTDQVVAGLEAAVDPDEDGDAHDAAKVAFVGVAEPFAAFADGPLARAVAGAQALDTLVVAPVGNDGPAGPSYGSAAGPGGAPAALTVGAVDLRRRSPSVHVLLRSGLRVLLQGEQPLGGALAPSDSLTAPVVVVPPPRATDEPGQSGLTSLFGRTGYSRVAGRAALLPRGTTSPEAVREAAEAGARAVLVDGPLPAGVLTLDDVVAIPILGLPTSVAESVRAARRAREPVVISLGASELGPNPGAAAAAPFSSRGLAFDGGLKPDLAAAGVGIATADPGRGEGGTALYGAVSGSSAAAAVAAGAAALLAQARPDLDAAALKGALIGTASPLGGEAGAVGTGLVDVDAAAAVEVVSDPGAAALGVAPPDGPARRFLRVRNVSSRPLSVGLSVDPRTAGAALVDLTPGSIELQPGQTKRVALAVTLAGRPRAPTAVRGTVRLKPANGIWLRVPWALALPASDRDLVAHVRLSKRAFEPSDDEPVVLSLTAGRVDGTVERPQLLALERLELELYRDDKRVGLLARVRDLLPGRYAFGLTGRDALGRRLGPGDYDVRVVAWPAGGGQPDEARVAFTILR
ncbi:MAG TPA: S8 family serine peptidase [Gaiellaceae bacterium]|nr:S8 family serine peptidase [Gaiellaceae bacterium]